VEVWLVTAFKTSDVLVEVVLSGMWLIDNEEVSVVTAVEEIEVLNKAVLYA